MNVLFILTKAGPWKILEDLWRVLGNSSYCRVLEFSRKASWRQGMLLWDDFFGLNLGERRMKVFALERSLSIPAYWHPPLQLISLQAENERTDFFKSNRTDEEGRKELHVSDISFLGTSYFVVKEGPTAAVEIMRAHHWLLRGLLINNFLAW